MPKHSLEKPSEVDVSNDTDDHKDDEEKNVQTEDDDRDPIKPAAIVRQIMKQDRHNACAHIDREP